GRVTVGLHGRLKRRIAERAITGGPMDTAGIVRGNFLERPSGARIQEEGYTREEMLTQETGRQYPTAAAISRSARTRVAPRRRHITDSNPGSADRSSMGVQLTAPTQTTGRRRTMAADRDQATATRCDRMLRRAPVRSAAISASTPPAALQAITFPSLPSSSRIREASTYSAAEATRPRAMAEGRVSAGEALAGKALVTGTPAAGTRVGSIITERTLSE